MLLILAVQDILQILTVLVLLHDRIDFHHLVLADPAIQVCDFLQAGNLMVLMLLHGLYEVSSINKALVCTSVQPSEALTQQIHVQGAVLQINAVQIGDFKFTTRRRFQVLCKFDHAVIIEVQASYAVVALRMLRLFLNRNSLTDLIELNDAETLLIVHVVAKHCCTPAALSVFYCSSQSFL